MFMDYNYKIYHPLIFINVKIKLPKRNKIYKTKFNYYNLVASWNLIHFKYASSLKLFNLKNFVVCWLMTDYIDLFSIKKIKYKITMRHPCSVKPIHLKQCLPKTFNKLNKKNNIRSALCTTI